MFDHRYFEQSEHHFSTPILSWPRLHEHLLPYKWEGNILVEVNVVLLTCTILYSSSFVNVPAKHVSTLTTMTMKRLEFAKKKNKSITIIDK